MTTLQLEFPPSTEPRPEGLPGILIAYDVAAVRTGLGEALQRAGFPVWVVPDGGQALDVYRRHGAEIALVVLDRRLPGLTGLQTLAALRTINPQVRCCFLTAAGEADDLLERGDASVLYKPMEPDEIVGILRHMVAGA